MPTRDDPGTVAASPRKSNTEDPNVAGNRDVGGFSPNSRGRRAGGSQANLATDGRKILPGSRCNSRKLVNNADRLDLIRRHESVSSLIAKARTEIEQAVARIPMVDPNEARKIQLALPQKYGFLRQLEERQAELAEQLRAAAEVERIILSQVSGSGQPR